MIVVVGEVGPYKQLGELSARDCRGSSGASREMSDETRPAGGNQGMDGETVVIVRIQRRPVFAEPRMAVLMQNVDI